MDTLPSGNFFCELEHVTKTGYTKPSLEDYWQQTWYELEKYLRDEPLKIKKEEQSTSFHSQDVDLFVQLPHFKPELNTRETFKNVKKKDQLIQRLLQNQELSLKSYRSAKTWPVDTDPQFTSQKQKLLQCKVITVGDLSPPRSEKYALENTHLLMQLPRKEPRPYTQKSLKKLKDDEKKMLSVTFPSRSLALPDLKLENALVQKQQTQSVRTNKRVYSCSYLACDKKYTKKSHLQSHRRSHTGEKPYKCSWEGCKWKFTRADELKRHFRKHTGVKPYRCTYCGRCFSRSDHLSLHSRKHPR